MDEDDDFEKYKERHEKSVIFLKEKTDEFKCLVVTHHAPNEEIATLSYNDNSSNFGTDILHFFNKKNIEAWIYGHTHRNRSWNIDGVKIISNQVGYPGEEESLEDSFNPCKKITI